MGRCCSRPMSRLVSGETSPRIGRRGNLLRPMQRRASGERTPRIGRCNGERRATTQGALVGAFCGQIEPPRWAVADQTIDARCSMDRSALLNGWMRVRQWIAQRDSMDRAARLNGWDKTFQWIDDHPSISRGILAGATTATRRCDFDQATKGPETDHF